MLKTTPQNDVETASQGKKKKNNGKNKQKRNVDEGSSGEESKKLKELENVAAETLKSDLHLSSSESDNDAWPSSSGTESITNALTISILISRALPSNFIPVQIKYQYPISTFLPTLYQKLIITFNKPSATEIPSSVAISMPRTHSGIPKVRLERRET